MKLNEIVDVNLTTGKSIILVSGNICSGKGTFCAKQFPGYQILGVSSIVKELSGFNKRSELGTTANLDSKIVARIIEEITKSSRDKIVVEGIRQLSIMEGLEAHFGDQIKDVIWLDVPHEVLKSRFEHRNAGKDDMDFEKSMQIDKNLGIDDVESYIRTHHRVVKNH